MVDAVEKKNKSKISIKIITKLISEFNLITKVAPRPIEYSKLRRKKKRFGDMTIALKATEIVYITELTELLKFLKNTGAEDQYTKMENSKLYTLIQRILLISDQASSEAVEYRMKSFKCLKDLISTIISEFDKYSNQLKYEIISFLFQVTQIVKKLVFENTKEQLVNKETFLLMIMQLLQPIDNLYKILRVFILQDTKGLLDLTPSQKWSIYQTIILS